MAKNYIYEPCQTTQGIVSNNYNLFKQLVPEMLGGSKNFFAIQYLPSTHRMKNPRLIISRKHDTVQIGEAHIPPDTGEPEYLWNFILWFDEVREICWVKTIFDGPKHFYRGDIVSAIDEPIFTETIINDGFRQDLNETLTEYLNMIIERNIIGEPYFDKIVINQLREEF
ncbi:MAG: hypothetical protein FWD71_11370 [Oscillospiraceae bacterium]|nr:hypothetical protein [Oscillospiraceae bacterium]